MIPSTRAKVAAAAGAHTSHNPINSVYDYSEGGHRSISAKLNGNKLNGFDYGSSSHFSGGGSNQDFYDYETGAHVHLRMNGTKFSGYDYHTGQHFSGTVNGRSVSIYDYGDGQHFNYQV